MGEGEPVPKLKEHHQPHTWAKFHKSGPGRQSKNWVSASSVKNTIRQNGTQTWKNILLFLGVGFLYGFSEFLNLSENYLGDRTKCNYSWFHGFGGLLQNEGQSDEGSLPNKTHGVVQHEFKEVDCVIVASVSASDTHCDRHSVSNMGVVAQTQKIEDFGDLFW